MDGKHNENHSEAMWIALNIYEALEPVMGHEEARDLATDIAVTVVTG